MAEEVTRSAAIGATSNRWTPGMIAASAFTLAYMLAAAIAAVISGNREFIFYIVVMLVLIGAVLMVHLRANLPTGLLWALSIWGGLHMAGGLVPVPESWPINGETRVLYSWWIIPRADGGEGWLKYDHITHAYGFAIATWLAWEGLRRAAPALRPSLGVVVLLIAAGCGFGAMNEVVEFIATRIAETNVGGYVNTGWDLVSNLTGSTVAALIIAIAHRRNANA